MSKPVRVYVCSEDYTSAIGTAEVVECYLEDEEDPAIILRGVSFDAEQVLSGQVRALEHDIEYYKQARDAERLTPPEPEPGRTFTRGDYNEWLEHVESLNVSNRGAVNMTLRRLGVSVPEPTSAELIELKLRELREEPGEWMTYATDSDISGFSQALDAKGVKASGFNDDH